LRHYIPSNSVTSGAPRQKRHQRKPAIERVQALADISRSGSRSCCHSNETRAPIANPHNSAQLEDTLYHSSKLYPGPCSSVRMRPGTDRQTDRQTHRHTDVRDHYTFRVVYDSRENVNISPTEQKAFRIDFETCPCITWIYGRASNPEAKTARRVSAPNTCRLKLLFS